MANEVKLTMVGDSTQLETSFDRVGESSKKMGDKVGESSKGFDNVGEGFDKAEQRAMGFRDTVTGVQDSVKGFSAVLKGDFSGDALLTAGMGIGDLASGFSNLLVPAMGSAVSWLGNTKVGMLATAAASKVWAAGQWLLNAALTANPIGLIIVAVVALIAIIVLIATKTTWFQDLWKVAWTWVKSTAVDVWEWLKALPDKIGDVFSKIGGFIAAPFKWAFNMVSDAWNNTVGKLRWDVPRWVPIIGGNTIGAPQLPKFHAGVGTVPGFPGQEVMAILQAGERVSASGGANSGPTHILRLGDSRLGDFIIEILAKAIGSRGGNVQVVLGK